MLSKSAALGAMALLATCLAATGIHAQNAAAPAAPPAAAARPARPQLLLSMTFENAQRLPLTQGTLTTSNAELHLYGDGKDILIAVGKGHYAPHTFNGLCDRPCGFAVSDRDNYFDLRGMANVKFTAITSGFHKVRPLIKLADGTLLIGDQADGSTADWHPYEVSFSEVRWLKLDPERGVTLGESWVENPDLSKVDEVGYFDVIPGSAVQVPGTPVEKVPPPPPGGWIAVSSFEVWGKLVPRQGSSSER